MANLRRPGHDISPNDSEELHVSLDAIGDRTELSEPVGEVLGRLARRWGKGTEFRAWILRDRWDEIVPGGLVGAVNVERVDERGRVVVTVPHSSALRMEIQRKGRRWRELFDACSRTTGLAFTDLVLDDPRSRIPSRKGNSPHE